MFVEGRKTLPPTAFSHTLYVHAISRVKAGACSFPSKLKVNCDNNLKLFINTSCSRTTQATMSLTWSSRPRRQSAITAVLIIVAVSSRRSVTADEKSASHMAAEFGRYPGWWKRGIIGIVEPMKYVPFFIDRKCDRKSARQTTNSDDNRRLDLAKITNYLSRKLGH